MNWTVTHWYLENIRHILQFIFLLLKTFGIWATISFKVQTKTIVLLTRRLPGLRASCGGNESRRSRDTFLSALRWPSGSVTLSWPAPELLPLLEKAFQHQHGVCHLPPLGVLLRSCPASQVNTYWAPAFSSCGGWNWWTWLKTVNMASTLLGHQAQDVHATRIQKQDYTRDSPSCLRVSNTHLYRHRWFWFCFCVCWLGLLRQLFSELKWSNSN